MSNKKSKIPNKILLQMELEAQFNIVPDQTSKVSEASLHAILGNQKNHKWKEEIEC